MTGVVRAHSVCDDEVLEAFNTAGLWHVGRISISATLGFESTLSFILLR